MVQNIALFDLIWSFIKKFTAKGMKTKKKCFRENRVERRTSPSLVPGKEKQFQLPDTADVGLFSPKKPINDKKRNQTEEGGERKCFEHKHHHLKWQTTESGLTEKENRNPAPLKWKTTVSGLYQKDKTGEMIARKGEKKIIHSVKKPSKCLRLC